MRTVKELLKAAVKELKESESSTPVLDAELIIIYVMGKYGADIDRSRLLLKYEERPGEQLEAEYLQLIDRRKQGEPVQYITGSQEFMGLDMHIRPGVLIPRPDTEILVERVVGLSKSFDSPKIIDMCTGSGAIAVSLAYYIKGSSVFAADISDTAVECTRFNVGRHKLDGRVTVVKSDLFKELDCLKNSVDIIVSNPPYIPAGEIGFLPNSVKSYEPVIALDGGGDGLDFYRRIVYNSFAYLKSGGILAFEIGYDQGHGVRALIEESGYFTGIELEKDLAGLDRCIWAYRL